MNHLNRGWTAGLLSLAMLGLVACSGGGGGAPPPSGVTSVSVSPVELSLLVGETGELVADVTVTGNASKEVTWSSGDHAVATVDADGTVTGIAAGSTTVTATSDHDATRQASAAVTVTAPGNGDGDGDGDGDGAHQPEDWSVTFGSTSHDTGYDITTDPQGNLIVVGATRAKLGDDPHNGAWDAFVAKLTPTGELVWLRQFGTPSNDTAAAVVTDADGNIFVTGNTAGTLFAHNAGVTDVYVAKYSPEGEPVWGDQFGTSDQDFVTAIALDGDAVLIAGSGMSGGPTISQSGGRGGFILRLIEDTIDDGVIPEWTLNVPDLFNAMVVTDDFIYVTGTRVVPGLGHEVLVYRIEPGGTQLISAVFGSGVPGTDRDVPDTRQPIELWEGLYGERDVGVAIVVDDDGNVYVTGYMGAHDTGTGIVSQQAYLARLNPELEEDWALMFESEHDHDETGTDLALDPDGNIVLTTSATSYYDQTADPGVEMVTRKVTPEGELLWERFYGESGWDRNNGLVVDGSGQMFVVGATYGEEGVGNPEGTSVFVRMHWP